MIAIDCTFVPRDAPHPLVLLGRVLCGRVDHLADFGDLGRWEAAQFRMLLYDVLVLGQVDTEGLVSGDVTLHPLNVGAKLAQDAVGLRRIIARAPNYRLQECLAR
jgi:hypothetical protein